VRSVVFFKERLLLPQPSDAAIMKQKIDSEQGRQQYSRRLAIVEPVFGDITHNKGLSRFSLRGWVKVNAQWKLYCLVHNLFKIRRYGLNV
jgi:hypothetical protein